jgi:hypothetical protein
MDGYRLKTKPSKQYKAKLRTSRKRVVAAAGSDDDITNYCISRNLVLLYAYTYQGLQSKKWILIKHLIKK